MIMKKLKLITMLACMALLAVGCGKDEGTSQDSYAELLLGKWAFVSGSQTLNGQTQAVNFSLTLEFFSTGECIQTINGNVSHNTYTLSGSTLTLHHSEGDLKTAEIKRLTQTELQIYSKETMEGDVLEENYLFKRV